MFNKKYKQQIKDLESKNIRLEVNLRNANGIIDQLRQIPPKDDLMATLMRESLGLQVDFSAANDKCMPIYYLDGMEEDERKNFIIDMESIRKNSRFQKVVRYMINLFATNAIYKYEEEERKNGQVAVIAFRTLLKEFDKMHKEYEGYKQKDDGFDPLATMPE